MADGAPLPLSGILDIDNVFNPIVKSTINAWCCNIIINHYIDVIMTTMASQIPSLTVVYSTVYSDADQRKHLSSASLAFVWGIHRDRWISRTKGQLCGKCFHLMTSSWSMPMLPITYPEILSRFGDMVKCHHYGTPQANKLSKYGYP